MTLAHSPSSKQRKRGEAASKSPGSGDAEADRGTEKSRETLKAPFKGVIATVPTAFDNQYRVDYGRMADATEHWVQAGLVNGRTALKVGPQWAKANSYERRSGYVCSIQSYKRRRVGCRSWAQSITRTL